MQVFYYQHDVCSTPSSQVVPRKLKVTYRRGLNNYEGYCPMFLIGLWYYTPELYLNMELAIIWASIYYSEDYGSSIIVSIGSACHGPLVEQGLGVKPLSA